MVRRQREMIKDLTPEDLEELDRLLDKVYQNILKSE